VVTQRCLPLSLSRSLLFAMLTAFVATTAHAEDAVDPTPGNTSPSQPPRPMMRLPRWIESIGEPAGPARPSQSTAAAPERTLTAAATAAPADSPSRTATATQARRTVEPAFRAEVKPAPALLQAGPAAKEPTGQLTAEWTERTPARQAAKSPVITAVADKDKPATKPAAGTAPGTLQRWFNERVAGLPKPAAKPADETADGEPAKDASDTPGSTPTIDQATTAQTAPARATGAVAADQSGKTTVTAPVAAAPDEMPTLSIDAASFRGVHPGKTTREELLAGWGEGEPFTREDGSRGFFWKIEPFERVEVSLEGDVVTAVRIKLAEPVAVSELAKQLEIADLRTVSIIDEQGVSIGEVFPERAVIFSVKPGTRSATAVMIESLDPESFVLRAEGEMDTSSAYAMADLQYAIEIDPQHLRAHRLLLVLMTEQGKWQQALQLAETAGRIDPSDVWTKLKHAGILLTLDRTDEAKAVVESVKATPNAPPLVTAQADRLLGRIELAAPTPDYQRAVEHFAEAIRRSSPLLTKQSPTLQQAAREIMLDAHLGTGLAIARGTWQQKARVIPKWMARSEAVVTECTADDTVHQTLELQLCRGALAIAAGSVDSVEPLPWVKRLLELRDRMGESVKDPWRRRQIDWQVGLGLLDALAAAQLRGDAADMLDNATLTAAYLDKGGEHRELTDKERKQAGDLHFRIGIMYSLQRGDHGTAVTWFDRVIPMWDDNPRLQTDREAGQLGESYVSMAISYWQVDRREDALALSRRGVDLMVAAVDAKHLEERALAVAYGNLSTMYAEEGDEAKSQTYAEMASRAEASGSKLR
jgi:tetratricopeptide (TPR) repeat protein